MLKPAACPQRTPEAPQRVFHLLFVEDSSADLELIQRQLRNGGIRFEAEVVCRPQEFRQMARERPFDAVLSDYRLPGWSGLEALRELRGLGLEIPFLLITGSLGEEKAVECMRQGADDCVLKDRLARLPLALQQAVEGHEMRERQQRITEELWASESKLGLLLSQLPAIIWTTGRDLRITALTGAESLSPSSPRSLRGAGPVWAWPPSTASSNSTAAASK